MVFAVIAAIALLSMYLVWHRRFGYPPRRLPQSLCFHKVTPEFQLEGTWLTPGSFSATIDRLLDRGYRFVDEDTWLAELAAPGKDAARSLFLTFDDGYEQVYAHACPVLAKRSIPFHVFVVSDYCGRENRWELSLGRPPTRHASWEQLREMVAAGAGIGSHTASHPDLTRVSVGRIDDELRRSREDIAERLGAAPRSVSYPFGRYNEAVTKAAARAGYEAGFSLYPRHHNSHVERFALRRNAVYIVDAPGWVPRKLDRNSLFWFEEMKCRAINAMAVLTPVFKRDLRAPDNAGRNGRGNTSATG